MQELNALLIASCNTGVRPEKFMSNFFISPDEMSSQYKSQLIEAKWRIYASAN